MREPDGAAYVRDNRISLAGDSLETVHQNGKLDISRNFATLIENRTSATNVNYKYTDGSRLLGQLGARGMFDKKYSKLGVPGLFIQLFDLFSEKA